MHLKRGEDKSNESNKLLNHLMRIGTNIFFETYVNSITVISGNIPTLPG